MYNPFIKKTSNGRNNNAEATPNDPLSVEDLLVDGTKKATVTSDGRLVARNDAKSKGEAGIDLVKQREWGAK